VFLYTTIVNFFFLLFYRKSWNQKRIIYKRWFTK